MVKPKTNTIKKMGQIPPGIVDIFEAAKLNSVRDLEVALRYQDVNTVDENGLTPLHYAAGYGSLEVIDRLLVEPGIDPTIEDAAGRRASLVAIHSLEVGSVEIAEKLRPFCYPGLDPDAE